MATDGRSEVSAGRTDASPPAGAVLRTNVQALDRAVGLLNAIAEAGPHGVTLRALAERALLPASTARTLLASLVAHGLVAQTSRERRYLLGTRFFELNRRFTSQADLSVVAAPVLHDLWKRTEETIHLAVLHGAQRADIAVLVGPQLLTIDPTTAKFADAAHTPLYRTAAGKVLFAALPRRERLDMSRAANWHDEDPPAEDTLMAQLDDIAEAGSATNVEEEAAGVCGVAAPVRDQTGATIASICIGYPAVRHSNSYVARMQRHVVDAGTELTALLGAEHT